MEEVREFVWSEERIDFHHKDLIILAKSFVDHIPDWMIDIIQRDNIDLERLEIRDIEQQKCIIVCLVDNLNEDGRIFYWIYEEPVD